MACCFELEGRSHCDERTVSQVSCGVLVGGLVTCGKVCLRWCVEGRG